MLREDLTAPRKQRHTARRVLARLIDEHKVTDLSYASVAVYVSTRRTEIFAEAGRPVDEVFVPTGLTAAASCRRNDKTSASQGTGDDWTCQLLLHLGIGATYTYEVNAKADGCYSAQGSPSAVGGRILSTVQGPDRVNPLFAFDGCFDTQ